MTLMLEVLERDNLHCVYRSFTSSAATASLFYARAKDIKHPVPVIGWVTDIEGRQRLEKITTIIVAVHTAMHPGATNEKDLHSAVQAKGKAGGRLRKDERRKSAR